MLPQSDALLSIAEIAATFAGFAALVTVFGRRRVAGTAVHDLLRLRLVIATSVVVVVTALVPVALAGYGMDTTLAWRIAAGTFLSEYARARKIGEVIRFVNDILLSAPSIVLGLFVYTLVVRTTGTFSGYAGSVAMAFIVLPVVVRTTDEMLRLVPSQMREAALSLGIPQWKVTTQILYRAALPGIVTGVLLALARIAGETAPLLFTAFNNQYWSTDMSGAMPNLPVTIFQFAMSPFAYWNQLAWAGAFLITLFVLAVSLVARTLLLRKKTQHD